MADLSTAPDEVARTVRPPATALPWLAWFGSLTVIVAGSAGAVEPAAAIGACVIAAIVIGRDRRALFTAAGGVALAMAALWVLWSLLLQRGGSGTVLWVLPSWNPPNGGSFGGPVTLSQLWDGLIRALRASAVVLAIGLLGQRVPAAGWLRLADAALGRAAALLAPLLWLGEVYLERRSARARALATGLRPGGGGVRLADLALAARLAALDPVGTAGPERTPQRGVLGLALQVALLVGWAIAILPGGPLTAALAPLELTVLWLTLALGTGLALHARELAGLRPTLADLPALLGAMALLGAWCAGLVAGEAGSASAPGPELPDVPWLTLSAIAVMPLGMLLSGERS